MTSVREAAAIASDLTEAISEAFFGRRTAIHRLLTGLFSGLHVLVEDIPGTGKTTLARAVAQACGADFGRIQCSPDLLPADITGMMIWDPHEHVFTFKPGPIMHQFVLVDELNRAATRTQAALLESMQEGAVTVDTMRYALPQPFFLVATQNPAAFTGTFPLPEAQLDRFGLSVTIGYPSTDDEQRILDYGVTQPPELARVIDTGTLAMIRDCVASVSAVESVRQYIIQLSGQTRSTPLLRLGLSPRASAHMLAAARAVAAIGGRDYVVPEDVHEVFLPVATHRVVLSAQASVEGRRSPEILETILRKTRMPSGV